MSAAEVFEFIFISISRFFISRFSGQFAIQNINDIIFGFVVWIFVVIYVLAILILSYFLVSFFTFLFLEEIIKIFGMNMFAFHEFIWFIVSHNIFRHLVFIEIIWGVLMGSFGCLFFLLFLFLLFLLLFLRFLLCKSALLRLFLQLHQLLQELLPIRVYLLLDLLNSQVVLQIDFTLLFLELTQALESLFVFWLLQGCLVQILPVAMLLFYFGQLLLNFFFLSCGVWVFWPFGHRKVFGFVSIFDVFGQVLEIESFGRGLSLCFTKGLSGWGDGC